MTRPRSLAIWMVLAALLLPGAHAWTQAHGDGARNALVPLPPGPLDVVATGVVPGRGEGDVVYTYAGAVLETPEGVSALLWRETGSAAECQLATFALDGSAEPLVRPVRGCRFGSLSAYHPPTGLLLVCTNANGGAPLVSAYRPREREPTWVYGQGPNGAAAGGLCMNVALDVERGLAYAAVTSSNPQIASGVHVIDVTSGARVLVAPATALSTTSPAGLPLTPSDAGELSLRAVTLTTTGFVVTGYTCGMVGNPCSEMWAAWYDRDGTRHGFERAASGKGTGTLPGQGPRAGSQFAAASGPLAALVVGSEVLIVSPETAEPILRAPLVSVEPPTRNIFYRSGAWTDTALVVQLTRSLRAFEPATLVPLWAWTEGSDSFVHDVYPAAGSFLVLAEGAEGPVIVKLAASTGRILERAQLPVPETHGELAITPLGVSTAQPTTRLLVMGGSGDYVVLGVSEPGLRPTVDVSDPFPAPGDEVEIVIRPGEAGIEPAGVSVAWGDAKAEPAEEGRARHVVSERGALDVHVRATFADGRTATTVLTLHVGATPPPELTPLQRAFSPENQEITFFILGATLTILGAAFTIGRQRRRHSKLERELAAVEEIRMLSTSDPRAAILSLKAFRHKLPEELAKRRIDDSQYHVLDVRTARLLRVLRTRMFAPWDALLSAPFHRLLDATFEDAIITPAEERALLDALQTESLTEDERASIAAVLRDFTT